MWLKKSLEYKWKRVASCLLKNRGRPIVPWEPVIPQSCDWNLREAHALSSRAPLFSSGRRRTGCSWYLIPVTGIWGWRCMGSLHVHLSVLQREEGQAAVDTSYLWLESEGGACALFTCTSFFFREKKDWLQLIHNTCDWNLRVVHALSSHAPLCSSERRRTGCSWYIIPVTGIWGWCMRSLHMHLSVLQREEGKAAVDALCLACQQ